MAVAALVPLTLPITGVKARPLALALTAMAASPAARSRAVPIATGRNVPAPSSCSNVRSCARSDRTIVAR